MQTNVYLLYRRTGASVTPERHITRGANTKSPAISPPRKYQIPNHYIKILITQKYPILPPIIAKHTTGYKPLFNDTHDPNYSEDDPNDSTNNLRNKNEDFVNKMKVNNNEDNDDEYKDKNSAALKND